MWILYVLFLAYRRFGKAAMATALSLIFAISFQPAIRVVEPQTTSVEGGSTVDVLVMCDEEFLAMGYNLTEVAMFIQEVGYRHFAQSNIVFSVKNPDDWLTWKSPDYTNCYFDLLQSAILAAGKKYGLNISKVELYEGLWAWGLSNCSVWQPVPGDPRAVYYIDLLMIYTGQDMDAWAVSPLN